MTTIDPNEDVELRRVSHEFNVPVFTPEVNLEIAIGAIHFRNKTIKNLREQIKNLKELALLKNDAKLVDSIQYKHLKGN
jgi:hypothetical protein